MRRIPAALCIVVISLVFASCGDEKTITETTKSGQVTTRTVPDVKFAKTKFVLYGGLAYGAFSRYIYKPYKAGSFKKGAPKRKRSIAKAAVAGAFTVNQLRLMRNAALSDDKLRPLADNIAKITPTLASLAAGFQGGTLGSTSDLSSISSQLDALVTAAKAAGVDVPTDKVPPIPGL
jgi:hypothetical protein